MADDFSIGMYSRHGAAHPNPMYDFLSGFAPRKARDLMRWCEYLFYNSPVIFAALQKLAAYPVTDITVETPDRVHKESWQDLLDHTLDVKAFAITTAIDVKVYGNSFVSVYKPFNRFLRCASCSALTGITHAGTYTFQLKTLKFKYTCQACKTATTGTIVDKRVADKQRIALIRWDPKLMDIDYNPITGKSMYYYTIPSDLKTKVEKGNAHVINTMPYEFLKAIQENKTFGFKDGQLYHMKAPAPAGIDAQWGLPPLTALIKFFFYTAVLRKANEAIALDHIVPFRVLHPAPISGTADPATQVNLANWQSKLEENIKMWRRDPLHIMFAPTALGVTMMGGQGRSLLTLGEVKDAEETIIAGLGVPREFLYGGLTLAGSGISLRMLENQLETDAAQQNDQLEWLIGQVAGVLNWKPVKARFIPFKLVDDTEQKALKLQLQQVLGGPISKGTLLEEAGLDVSKEREKVEQEQLDDMRSQMKLQKEQQKLMTSASQQAQQAAMMGQGLGYNAQAVMAAADQQAQQLMQLDPGTRRSQMDHLSQEDPVMYACVRDKLESYAQMQRQQASAQMQQGGGAMGAPGPGGVSMA